MENIPRFRQTVGWMAIYAALIEKHSGRATRWEVVEMADDYYRAAWGEPENEEGPSE